MMFFASLAGVASGAATILILKLVHGQLAAQGSDPTPPEPATAGAFALLAVAVAVFSVISYSLLSYLGQTIVLQVRLLLSQQILAAPLPRLETVGSHRLLATLTDDVSSISGAAAFIPELCINGAIVLGGLGYLAWLDPSLFLLLFVALILGVVTYQLPSQAGIRRFRRSRQQQDVLFGHFRSLTEGTKELKLNRRRSEAFLRLVEESAELTRKLRVGATLVFSSAAAWGRTVLLALLGVLIFAPPDWVQVDRGVLSGYVLVLLFVSGPLQLLLNSVQTVGQAEVALAQVERLGFFLGSAEESISRSAQLPEASAKSWRSLRLHQVTYSYRVDGVEHPFTVGPVDLELSPGEIVFLVGGNGSGKTTLAKLLVGLYPLQTGELWLDDRKVEPAELDHYRQLFSAVFSDFYLFETLLGLESVDLDARAREHLQALDLQNKVRVENGRLSTTELSQGQRKRLALLTAYLEDRPICLFDEWAADQDPVFKEVFYHRILPELKLRGKAVVVISHDDRYFRVADRVIRLEEGRIGQG